MDEGEKSLKVKLSTIKLSTRALLMIGLVIGVGLSSSTCYATEPPYNETDAKEFDPDILPWDNETDIIILPTPPLPPIFSNFSITPTEIQIGNDLIISFVITNTNNHSITWMSTTRIGGFFTQIIEIELESYESKLIWYRIIPHLVTAQYDVWIDGQTGTFMVIPPDPLPITNETDPVIIVTDQDLASIQSQLYNIYDAMMMHDTLIMNGRSSVRELNTTFNAEIADLIERDESFDLKLTTEIERKDEQIQQLDEQIELLEEKLARELKKTRNSMNIISIMFGLLSVIAIGIVIMKRRT